MFEHYIFSLMKSNYTIDFESEFFGFSLLLIKGIGILVECFLYERQLKQVEFSTI